MNFYSTLSQNILSMLSNYVNFWKRIDVWTCCPFTGTWTLTMKWREDSVQTLSMGTMLEGGKVICLSSCKLTQIRKRGLGNGSERNELGRS